MDDLDMLIKTLPEDEQRTITKRANELVTAHNLRELRTLAGRTHKDVSAQAGFKQTNVLEIGEVRRHEAVDASRLCRTPRRRVEDRRGCRGQESRSFQHRGALSTRFKDLSQPHWQGRGLQSGEWGSRPAPIK